MNTYEQKRTSVNIDMCYNGIVEKEERTAVSSSFFDDIPKRGEGMNRVQPIRDKATIKDIFDYLKEKNVRDAVMFATGIYTGLRISDILSLKVRDVRGKDYIYLREKKTGKEKRITLNRYLKNLYTSYIEGKKDYESLFAGRQRINRPISRQRAYRILADAGKQFGIEDGIGTHTMRKTFGYHYYQKTKDVATLMEIFNHDHESITLKYIGITQDTISKVYENMDLLE